MCTPHCDVVCALTSPILRTMAFVVYVGTVLHVYLLSEHGRAKYAFAAASGHRYIHMYMVLVRSGLNFDFLVHFF